MDRRATPKHPHQRHKVGTIAMPPSYRFLDVSRSSARLAHLLGLGFLVLLSGFVVAQAQEVDWKVGKLGHLAPHIGTYSYVAVLGDPEVEVALKGLVGADLAGVIAINLNVASPIDFVSGHLVLRGNAPHQGGEEEAMVLVKIYDGTVRAALLHKGRMRLFAPDAEYDYLPPPLKDFLRSRDDAVHPNALPRGVEWLREPQR